MAIAEGLAAKAAIGLGALGAGATGIYFGGDYLINSLSNYDKALIKFLEVDDQDVVFVTDPATISFSTGSQTTNFSVKVQLSSGTSSSFKKNGSASGNNELTEIQKLNNGTWTWECTFTFEKKTGTANDIENDFKNRILGADNKGLLGILTKDVSNYSGNAGGWDKKKLKGEKIEFIKKCGYERRLSENKKINRGLGDGNAVKANVSSTFEFEEKNSQLVPKDENLFEYWFKKDYGSVSYSS